MTSAKLIFFLYMQQISATKDITNVIEVSKNQHIKHMVCCIHTLELKIELDSILACISFTGVNKFRTGKNYICLDEI